MNLIFSPLLLLQNLSLPVAESLDTLSCCTCLPLFCPLPLYSSNRCLCCWAQQTAWLFFLMIGLKYHISAYTTVRLPSPKWNSFPPFLINILCLSHRNLCWTYLLFFFFPKPYNLQSQKKPNFIFSSHIVISSCQISVCSFKLC